MKKVFILTLGLIVGSVSLNAMDLMLERYSSLQGISSTDRSIIEKIGNKNPDKKILKAYQEWEKSVAKSTLENMGSSIKAIKNINTLKNEDTTKEYLISASFRGISSGLNSRYGNLQIKASNFLFKDGEISNSLTYYNVFWGAYKFLKESKTIVEYRKRAFGLALLSADWYEPKRYDVETGDIVCRFGKCLIPIYKAPDGIFYITSVIRNMEIINQLENSGFEATITYPNGQNFRQQHTTKDFSELTISLLFNKLNNISLDKLNKKVIAKKYLAIKYLATKSFTAFEKYLNDNFPLYRVY